MYLYPPQLFDPNNKISYLPIVSIYQCISYSYSDSDSYSYSYSYSFQSILGMTFGSGFLGKIAGKESLLSIRETYSIPQTGLHSILFQILPISIQNIKFISLLEDQSNQSIVIGKGITTTSRLVCIAAFAVGCPYAPQCLGPIIGWKWMLLLDDWLGAMVVVVIVAFLLHGFGRCFDRGYIISGEGRSIQSKEISPKANL